MNKDINGIKKRALDQINGAKDEGQLEKIRIKFLGKKSQLSKIITEIPSLDKQQKKLIGKIANQAKRQIENLIVQKNKNFINQKSYNLPTIDLTKPGAGVKYGHLHPITLVLDEIYQIFANLGFAIIDGPEIENDWYNFEALNLPVDHPARDMQDTFYLIEQQGSRPMIPRTHTSGMQVRFMEKNKPPFKIIVPGKVFRNENEDATHSWIFTQIEGLAVSENVSLADMKGTLLKIMQGLMGKNAEIRLRPSYFPYTEPSVEIDTLYKGKWLELAGAGMVHPQVLENSGVDSNKYRGFAFGLGAERIAIAKYGISDLRNLWRPKLEYLEQF
ncbi:MAG: phenylalanine--tRNA ligase subunit alpha [bacterium]|nr:phenylalanine--tRNA ligase subunit alpha [bacterium]